MKKEKSKPKSNISSILKRPINHNPIRIIYKQANNTPKIKIINDVHILEKMIVKKDLCIIPYQSLYIICNSKKSMEKMTPNIALPFYKISGDLILVNIDREQRKFKSLSQDDIIWFSKDLINKSFINDNDRKRVHTRNHSNHYEKYYEAPNSDNTNNFEKDLINALVNIELTLASLLRNGGKNDE